MQADKPIYWHEGLFIRPQHFQQFDQNCRQAIQNRIDLFESYQWGINSLAMVDAAISNDIIEIENIDVLFQDGSLVRYPGNCKIQARNIAKLWQDTSKPLSIYIALRRNISGKSNVNLTTKGELNQAINKQETSDVRYSLPEQGVEVADYFSDDKFSNVLFLDYHIRILVESELDSFEDYHLIKIAEVTKELEHTRFSSSYIPPLLQVAGNPAFMCLIRQCYEQSITMVSRLNAKLNNSRKNRRNSNQLNDLFVLQILSRYLPVLEEYLRGEAKRPYDVYVMLRQFISEIQCSCRVDDSNKNSNFSKISFQYNHDAIYTIFTGLTNELLSLYKLIVSSPDLVVPLSFDGTYYFSDLSSVREISETDVYLSVNTEMESKKVKHIFESLAKTSSRQQLPILISKSVNTTDLIFQSDPDDRLPRNSHVYYFRINKISRAWEAVIEDRNIAVYLGNKLGNFSLNLVLLRD